MHVFDTTLFNLLGMEFIDQEFNVRYPEYLLLSIRPSERLGTHVQAEVQADI
jgi:hypothetical protein